MASTVHVTGRTAHIPLVQNRAGQGRGQALLGQALGVTASTAVRWSELAGRTYSGYTHRVVDGEKTTRQD